MLSALNRIFPSTPPFAPNQSKYDQNTMIGRFLHFFNIINPMTLFYSKKRLNDSLELLKKYSEGKASPNVTNDDLWMAQKVKDSMVHPDSGSIIPLPFRMSAFVPINLPIAIGMTLSSPSLASVIFWQWMNQTYNVTMNYANRNASNHLSIRQLLKAYTASVGVAGSIAVSLTQIARRATSFSPFYRSMIMLVAPFTSVSMAGALNVALIRRDESVNGVNIFDKYGNNHGVSKVAGKSVVSQVMITRAVLPFPIILFPQIIMRLLMKIKSIKNRPFLYSPLNASVFFACLWIAMPLAVSLFPQTASFESKKLERRFHNIRNKNGDLIDRYYCNKGL